MDIRATLRRSTVFSILVIVVLFVVTLGVACAAEDLVVAVDKATLVKFIGVAILAFQAEIWRNQRVLFKSNEKLSNELQSLKGYCKGRTECAADGE